MDGVVTGLKKIGEHVGEGEVIAGIRVEREMSPRRHGDASTQVYSPFAGILRGLIHDGLRVTKGTKIGDVDARNDASACFLVSDKSLAIGGGALEAVLSKAEIREKLYSK